MLGNFAIYLKHGFGFCKAFRYAFGVTVRDFLLNTILLLITLGLLTSLLTMMISHYDDAITAAQLRDVGYVQALERIVTACTAPGDNPITVEGELWMCGATNTGIKL